MADASPLSRVRDSVFAMLATYLAAQSRDIAHVFPNIAKDPKGSGHRIITFEGSQFFVSSRSPGDFFVTPGVNLYFGDTSALTRKVLPQRWRLPVMIHVLAPYTNEKMVGDKQAERLSELVQNAFENLGGILQVYDLTVSPPSPVVGRYVTWAKSFRGDWKGLGDPTKDVYTNRQWTFEVRYVR